MSEDPQSFWDGVYADPGRRSGRPHSSLVEAVTRRSPGAALELGSGDGSNAVWLATQGWTVTGVDVSAVALDRAAAQAGDAGASSRVRWERADLADWTTSETFDLVAALFLHTPLELDRAAVLARAAAQVRAAGTLLVVGHRTVPPWAWNPDAAEDLPSAGEVAAALALAPPHWRVHQAEEVARTVTSRDGLQASVLDAVVHAVRAG